jgi:hypothetical protein
MEYDAVIADRLEPTIAETCRAVGKRPDLSRVSTSLLRPGPEFPDYRRVRMVGGRQGDPLGGGAGGNAGRDALRRGFVELREGIKQPFMQARVGALEIG